MIEREKLCRCFRENVGMRERMRETLFLQKLKFKREREINI